MKSILYFSAKWCGPCKIFKPVVQQVDGELGLGIRYVDVDQERDLATKYGISSVPTILVENNGNVAYRASGVMSKPQLVSALQQFR